jgi:hypothetical protein
LSEVGQLHRHDFDDDGRTDGLAVIQALTIPCIAACRPELVVQLLQYGAEARLARGDAIRLPRGGLAAASNDPSSAHS